MKNELLDIYHDVSYYFEKAEENLRSAGDILNRDLAINGVGYETENISEYRQILVDAKYDVDEVIIPEINNLEA